ncbi:MAG: PASTA domain-containing protein [Bacteroidales bacterium]|nr:PASTA domain-containing protein [Bacteroidales bacterium]
MKKPFWKDLKFWKTITLMIVASILIIVLTFASLRIFTRHGQSFVVPDLTGLTMNHLGVLEQNYRFRFKVIDSVFDETQPAGTIIRQNPWSGATVKRGRQFYITLVAAMPDMVRMPNLIDLSLRQAASQLQTLGLNVGTVTYRHDMDFQGAVLDQVYRGVPIRPGENIRRGSSVDLVVSGGPQEERRDREPEVIEQPPIFEDEF